MQTRHPQATSRQSRVTRNFVNIVTKSGRECYKVLLRGVDDSRHFRAARFPRTAASHSDSSPGNRRFSSLYSPSAASKRSLSEYRSGWAGIWSTSSS